MLFAAFKGEITPSVRKLAQLIDLTLGKHIIEPSPFFHVFSNANDLKYLERVSSQTATWALTENYLRNELNLRRSHYFVQVLIHLEHKFFQSFAATDYFINDEAAQTTVINVDSVDLQGLKTALYIH